MRDCRPGPSKVGNTTASGAPHQFVMSRVHTENVARVGHVGCLEEGRLGMTTGSIAESSR